MDRQTVYKLDRGYYTVQNEQLIKRGYKIIKNTKSYTIYEETENDKSVEENKQRS